MTCLELLKEALACRGRVVEDHEVGVMMRVSELEELVVDIEQKNADIATLRDFIGRLGKTIHEAEKHVDPSILYGERYQPGWLNPRTGEDTRRKL